MLCIEKPLNCCQNGKPVICKNIYILNQIGSIIKVRFVNKTFHKFVLNHAGSGKQFASKCLKGNKNCLSIELQIIFQNTEYNLASILWKKYIGHKLAIYVAHNSYLYSIYTNRDCIYLYKDDKYASEIMGVIDLQMGFRAKTLKYIFQHYALCQ